MDKHRVLSTNATAIARPCEDDEDETKTRQNERRDGASCLYFDMLAVLLDCPGLTRSDIEHARAYMGHFANY